MTSSAPKLYLHLIALCLWLLAGRPAAFATATIEEVLPNHERIEIVVKKSFLIKLNQNAERVSVVAPEIADVQIVDPRQILITGSSVGETSLIIWTEGGDARMIDVLVEWNTAPIQDSIRKMLPDEAVQVLPMENGVALQGQASSLDSADQLLEITQQYAPNVVNLLQVPGQQQVLLKVKIAEVASVFRQDTGFNFIYNGNSFQGGSLLGKMVSGDLAGDNNSVQMSDIVTLFFGIPNSDIKGFVQALRERGWIHILAQPNLIARSGETASFLAGGEFPIPVPQGMSNNITIEYKEYGVRLNFTPTVISEKTVHLDIAPEVSDLDFSNGIKLNGYAIPTLVTRRAKTVVQLDDGQTFAIAGLMNKASQNTTRKVPFLGEVPLFGSLFSGKNVKDQETELLIMVTPYLIAPLEKGTEVTLPTVPLEEAPATQPAPSYKVTAQPIRPEPAAVTESALETQPAAAIKIEAMPVAETAPVSVAEPATAKYKKPFDSKGKRYSIR